MSTRGAYGFRIGGKDIIGFNHFDSYPECLGVNLLEALKRLLAEHGVDGLKARVYCLNQPGKAKPTKEQIKVLKPYAEATDLKWLKDWYNLTHKLQGDIEESIKCGWMPQDEAAFLIDSLFCEWAYIINLDEGAEGGAFEVYQGFNHSPSNEGRYSNLEKKADNAARLSAGDKPYYGVRLVRRWAFDSLPTNETFITVMKEEQE